MSQIQILSYLLSSIKAARMYIGLTFGHRNHQRACSWKKKKKLPLLFFAAIGCLYYSTRGGVWWALPLFMQDHWLVWSYAGNHVVENSWLQYFCLVWKTLFLSRPLILWLLQSLCSLFVGVFWALGIGGVSQKSHLGMRTPPPLILCSSTCCGSL